MSGDEVDVLALRPNVIHIGGVAVEVFLHLLARLQPVNRELRDVGVAGRQDVGDSGVADGDVVSVKVVFDGDKWRAVSKMPLE